MSKTVTEEVPVVEITKELARVDETIAAFNDNALAIYTTNKETGVQAQTELYNAISTAEPLSENLGVTLSLKNFVIQKVSVIDEQTQREVEQARTILIDDDGNAYAAVSEVLVRDLQNLVGIFGEPHTWDNPIPVSVNERKSRSGRKFFSLKVG